MVFVVNGRTGLALGEDAEDRRTAGEDERLSLVAVGFVHHRHGVTILSEALRSPLDLSDAGEADNGIYFGYGRGQARGIGEVADDWCHSCGSQLRERVVSLRHSHDLMALLEQLSGDGASDESGCAGDKNLHGASITSCSMMLARTRARHAVYPDQFFVHELLSRLTSDRQAGASFTPPPC